MSDEEFLDMVFFLLESGLDEDFDEEFEDELKNIDFEAYLLCHYFFLFKVYLINSL